MGQRGSEASREVSVLVLLDDTFATIVGAVEEGRGLSEVLLVAGGAVVAFFFDLQDAAGFLMDLWGVVFGGASLSWGMAEAVSRFVWRNPGQRVGR